MNNATRTARALHNAAAGKPAAERFARIHAVDAAGLEVEWDFYGAARCGATLEALPVHIIETGLSYDRVSKLGARPSHTFFRDMIAR